MLKSTKTDLPDPDRVPGDDVHDHAQLPAPPLPVAAQHRVPARGHPQVGVGLPQVERLPGLLLHGLGRLSGLFLFHTHGLWVLPASC